MFVSVPFTVKCEIRNSYLVPWVYSHIDAIHWMRVMKLLVSMVLKCQRAMTEQQ